MKRSVLTVLILCIAISSASSESTPPINTGRFYCLGGAETPSHEVDPDYGDRREWFQVDSNTWVQRYADGFVSFFSTVGHSQINGVDSVVVKLKSGHLEYAIPVSLSIGETLLFRSGDTGPFGPATTIHAIESDQSNTGLVVSVLGDLTSIRDAIFKQIPTRITEAGSPQANDYRWQFDGGTNFVPVPIPHLGMAPPARSLSITNGRIFITQEYSGDFETKRTFGGCHLKPLNLNVEVDFAPGIQQSGTKWLLDAQDPHVQATILPGSDTKCSILGFDVAGHVNDAINGAALKSRVIDALNKAAVELPLESLWSKAAGPFVRSTPQLDTICIYPNLSSFTTGLLLGTIDHAAFTLSIKADPIIRSQKAPCPAALVGQPSVLQGNNYAPSTMVFDAVIGYPELKQTLLNNKAFKDAGIDDLSITPYKAYMAVHLHYHTGNTITLNAVPMVPIPQNEGDLSVQLVFTDVDGSPLGNDQSAFNGAYSHDFTDQLAHLQETIKGNYSVHSFSLNVLDAGLNNVFISCEPDGLHGYVTLNITTSATFTMNQF